MKRNQTDSSPVVSWFNVLSDPARLRILRLIDMQELSVGELSRALQLPQSTMSRHLKILHESGWIVRWSEGPTSRFRLDRQSLGEAAAQLWELTRSQLGDSPTYGEDDRRAATIVAERHADSRAYFGKIGGEWDHVRCELFGSEFTAESLLGLLPGNWIVADLGCGTGNIAELVAPYVLRVVAVDREPAMLDAARKRLSRFGNVKFKRGDLSRLPLRDEEVHAVIVSLVMHHVADPEDAMTEMARVLKPGGRALVIDMIEHDRESYRQLMGHIHLGFSRHQVEQWANHPDLEFGGYHVLAPHSQAKGPGLFVATFDKRLK